MPTNHFNKLRKSAFVKLLFSSVLSNLILFSQPLQGAIANYNTTKIYLPQGNGYNKTYNEEEVTPFNNVIPNYDDSHNNKTSNSEVYRETATVYYAIEKNGVIGKLNISEGENPYDNFFSIDLPNDINTDKYKATLLYDVYGVKNASQTTKSINNHSAYGGQVVELSNEWVTVKEQVPVSQLQSGRNEIYFNRRANSTYQYKIKNIRIGLEPIDNTSQISEVKASKYAGKYYLQGIVSNSEINSVEVSGYSIPVIDGVFEHIFSEIPENLKELNISYKVAQNNNNFIVSVVESKVEPIFVANNTDIHASQNYLYKNLLSAPLSYESICIAIKDNIETNLTNENEFLIQGLQFKDIRVANDDIEIVTGGDFSAYRIKQSSKGESMPIQIHLKYNDTEIPDGYTVKDVKTFYFDRKQKSWKALAVDSLDYENNEIISSITSEGDTDYINGVIKVPDSPETGSFAPTMISDMKYADPTAGVVSIAPPSPNSNGTVTTGFPIKVPQGRGGMQPSLNISYSSEAGNGWMGLGWNLATPAISINTKWGVPRFDLDNESEIYSLNGSDLVLKNGTEYTNPHRDNDIDRVDERRFYQRKEGAYNLIIRHGNHPNNYWWEVTDKQGNKSFYGGWYNTELSQYQFDNNSVIRVGNSNSNITHWALKATLDTYGNYTLYEYASSISNPFSNSSIEAKYFYLSNIKYTLFNPESSITGQSHYMVDFKRNQYTLGGNTINRSDVIINGRNGYLNIVDDLLTEIHISFNESGQSPQRIRSYKFDYEEKAFKKHQLVTISEYDKTNSLFYSNTIEYHDDIDPNTDAIINSSSTAWNANSSSSNIPAPLQQMASIIPDGSPLGTSTSTGGSIALRAGFGVGFDIFSTNNTIGGAVDYSWSNQDTKVSFIDINGDGLPDKVYEDGSGIYYRPNIGTGFGTSYLIDDINTLSKTNSKTNGKGVDANAFGFGIGGSWSKTSSMTENYFTDFNGDGLPDMMRGNRIKFNITAPLSTNSSYRKFDDDVSLSENKIVPGSINSSIIPDLHLETMDELREEHSQFDHVKVWRAPYDGTVRFENQATLIAKNNDGENANNFRLTIEKSNNNGTDILHTSSLVNAGQTNSFDFNTFNGDFISVSKGDIIFFRIHNLDYGYGGEIEWNPRVIYTDTSAMPYTHDNSSSVIDENGKAIGIFDAEADFMMNNDGGVSIDDGSTSVTLKFNLLNGNFAPGQFSDDIRFIIKKVRIDYSDGSESPQGEWTRKLNYNSGTFVWDFNSISDQLDASEGYRDVYFFYAESDSNVDWSTINWRPSIISNANPSEIIYPPVSYHTYDDNVNQSKYWFSSYDSELISPTEADVLADPNKKFMRLTHTFFDQNTGSLLNGLNDEEFPVKVTWVVKKKIGNTVSLFRDHKVFYIYRLPTNDYIFTKSENINDVLDPTLATNSSYYTCLFYRAQMKDIVDGSGTIYSTFYVNDRRVALNNNTSMTLALDPYAGNYSFTPITVDAPFMVSSPIFLGATYRGWGQFLYNGGMEFERDDEGEITNLNNPATPFGDLPIDVSLFDYESQTSGIENIDPQMDPSSVTAPGGTSSIRYTFYNEENENNKYVNKSIINAIYGFNNNDVLTATVGRFGEGNLHEIYVDEDDILLNETGTFIALKQRSVSKGTSLSGSYSVGSATESKATSRVLNQYLDLNGDRHPDLITDGRIQFTNMLGALSGTPIDNEDNFVSGDRSEDFTVGITLPIKPSSTAPTNQNGIVNGSVNRTNTSVNSGINTSNGKSYDSNQWVDMNGDGLPDKVKLNNEGTIEVWLNTGYGFSEKVTWGSGYGDSLFTSTRNNVGVGAGIGGSFTPNSSFAAGFGASYSTARIAALFIDVNNDGLPDLVIRVSDFNYAYYLNNGKGFETVSSTFYNNNLEIEKDYSLSGNIYGSFTGGFIIPSPAIFVTFKIVFTPSLSFNGSYNEKTIMVQDIDGDGLPDILSKSSNNNNDINARLNKVGKTHLLKKVNTPLGGSWSVTYERDGNTYEMPQSKWVLKTITTNDGFSQDGDYKPNTSEIAVNYGRPNYDRREREFYGYSYISINQVDPATSAIYRTITKAYHNKNYYLSGAEYSTIVRDENNNTLSESTTLYNLLDPDDPVVNMDATEEDSYLQTSLIANAEELFDKSRLFIAPVRVTSKVFENGPALTTVKDFSKYDEYGNLLEYIDYGEDEGDNYKTIIKYVDYNLNNADNAFGLPSRVSVYNLDGSQLLRQRIAGFNHFAKMSSIKIYSSIEEGSKYEFRYDEYGNVNRINDVYNTNAESSIYYKQIVYEPILHTYPISVENSFGENSSVEYEYLFGSPTLTTDVNGQQMRTRIDNKGRVTEVTGPNEMALESVSGPDTAWTIRMEYENSFEPDDYNEGESQHHAITRHFDPEYANGTNITTNELLTVSIVDGFGQPIQVKKTHFSDTTKWLINGFEKKDAFGRVLESYLPVTQTYNGGNSPYYHHISYSSLTDNPVVMTYDAKDRVKTVKQPGETDISSIDYSISDGMLIQKMTTENDGTTQTLDTYTDIRGRQRKTVQNDTKTILYTYNAINELLKVTDENSETSYKYDLAGRVLEVRQPDRGLTTYKYDNANRLIEQSNSNLIINDNQTIKYHYNYDRLVRIEYPQNPLNEVKYTYGAPNDPLATSENAVGRLLKLEDATGVQVYGYGHMGEVTKNLRSVAVAGHHSYWFLTEWQYDSWNRVKQIIYPDREIVNYKYNLGGMIDHIGSEMLGIPSADVQPVVENITYNDYGERTSITYGNGTSTIYDYDERRRMNSLQHNFAGSYQVNKHYTYDVLSNITRIETTQPQNSLPGQGQLGGPVYHKYIYDNFNRLTDAEGHYTGPNDIGTNTYLRQEYELHMEYNNDHTIRKKTQVHWQGEVSSYGPIQQADKIPVHKTSYILDYSQYATGEYVAGDYGYVQQHAPRKIVETPGWVTNPAQNDPRIREKTIEYDANGNQTEIKEKVGELEISLRKNLWDEENRLMAVDLKPDDHDNRPVAIYTYDAGGERTIRYNYDRIDVYSNADQIATQTNENIMIYPSGLMMGKVREAGALRDIPLIYTKHYYIGAERISAKTATAHYLCYYPNGVLADIMPDLQETMVRPQSTTSVEDAATIVSGVFNVFGIIPPTFSPDYTPEDDNTHNQGTNLHNPAKLQIFYFHPDHLGSSSYITNKAGTVSQHMEYLPFGETLADEHLNSHNSPFKFNGKEYDEETGNYYYSARYYDPKLSIFISVDPLAHKMPAWSPYNYTFNNPIRYTDPDGRIPIIPWLLKAGAGAAADMLAQASMDYLFNSNTTSWGQAFDNVNYYQVARSGAEGLIPWRTPGGKIGRAAATATGDVLVNAINDPNNYTAEQAGLDFATGFVGDLAGGGFGQILNKYGSKAVINGLMDKLGYSATQVRKMTGGFDGDAVRKWYKSNVDGMNIKVSPTEANARSIVGQRNSFKQQARDLMSDQNAAGNLPAIQDYDYYYNKSYNKGLRGDALYQDIINGGQKTNATYNKKYGE
ncbi:hypothetical protein DVK85_08440 [Flavobacterium arcticum]|uniref:Insecticide toxin TcdB middle/N-terminal domain-containing protein n=1 Tax=Flavobacterium arcticum TaxID=1784713 RepID=A0A345HCF1_9FLAO|nr:SpvB/TcaC N-terminal domain-containing protein [Flavobacterium arcticum]AXG74261.1 hypothetical protein DVK85_08440 [Flavobacterium arcticum]KAF2508148.1 hypothetical protein E0W72_10860 [Flavobacterium arcticum]